jgi:hypothetical protein
MIAATTTVTETNDSLKREFRQRGLDLAGVWVPTPEDPVLENGRLQALLVWVDAYTACPNRKALQKRGFEFPPVDPDCDPDSDWLKFERWMKGLPLDWSYEAEFGGLKDPDTLTDVQVERELERVLGLLETRQVYSGLSEEVPPRVEYACIVKQLKETRFEYVAPGTNCVLTGCSGDCEECLQRPWCVALPEDV